jgi:hypothetical protein
VPDGAEIGAPSQAIAIRHPAAVTWIAGSLAGVAEGRATP